MMSITRFGFNLLVAIYLGPLVLMDIWGNTVTTGTQSEIYYIKAMVDGVLIAYAIYELFTDKGTASVGAATARKFNTQDSVVSFSQLSAFEYIYCAFLCVYAAVNWWLLHSLNSETTGIQSIATLVWSFLSLAVALLSAVQFWRIKSGALVELSHKISN